MQSNTPANDRMWRCLVCSMLDSTHPGLQRSATQWCFEAPLGQLPLHTTVQQLHLRQRWHRVHNRQSWVQLQLVRVRKGVGADNMADIWPIHTQPCGSNIAILLRVIAEPRWRISVLSSGCGIVTTGSVGRTRAQLEASQGCTLHQRCDP
jgi:hypothetical protein